MKNLKDQKSYEFNHKEREFAESLHSWPSQDEEGDDLSSEGDSNTALEFAEQELLW